LSTSVEFGVAGAETAAADEAAEGFSGVAGTLLLLLLNTLNHPFAASMGASSKLGGKCKSRNCCCSVLLPPPPPVAGFL
jgi:hypothetical protein